MQKLLCVLELFAQIIMGLELNVQQSFINEGVENVVECFLEEA